MSERYGPYEVLERVAEGSTSTVYRARHVELDRQAAIKELHADVVGVPAMRDRLRAEAEILSRLSDPNLVQVYDYVEENDRAWLAEEWVDGASLERILAVHRALTPEQSVGVIRGAVLGLAHAHDQGVLHRDISPSNILADMEGTSKLVDFGLAAPVGDAGFSGTPAYMSPEAARGEQLSKPSDIYSTAAVLFTLLAGRAPFAGSDLPETLRRVSDEPAPVLEVHGSDLQGLLRRSMAKDPAERPQDARVFLAELEDAARRRFGAAWLQRASIAGLVAAAVPAVVGGGAAVAPTVVVDSAAIVSCGAANVAKSARSTGRKLALAGVAAAAVVAGAVTVSFAVGGDDGSPDASLEDASTSDDAEPEEAPSPPPPPTLEELTPTGTFRLTRTLLSSTYDEGTLPKKDSVVWTLDVKKCKQEKECSGTIASSSGKTFQYSWNGKRLAVAPPRGGRTVDYEGLCFDTVTNEKIPGTLGRVVTVATWTPLQVAALGEDDIPKRLEGTQRLVTTYSGLEGNCEDSPTDRARYQVTLVRR